MCDGWCRKLYPVLIGLFLLISADGLSQNTLLLEKLGSKRKFWYVTGDPIRLRACTPDTLLAARIWEIKPDKITLETWVPLTIRLDQIKYVYVDHLFARKFGIYCCIFSGVTFGVIGINHLINNEQFFTPDMAYLTLPFLGAGIVSLSLSRERIHTGLKWKLKVFDMPVFR
jgi:hypothetical protein